jgi:RHS repeat-associated protein
LTEKSYLWGVNDKLLSVVTDGKVKSFEYDGWGNLSKAFFEDGSVEYRNPDKSGNLFETLDRQDRKYAKGGQLLKAGDWEYKYDKEGNLIRKKGIAGSTAGQVWRYEWNAAGMLAKVKRPDAREVTFKYDALGRRIEKRFGTRITSWLWNGNVPLHERAETRTPDFSRERGYFDDVRPEPVITWVFEEGTFVPAAKLTEKERLSIATNYMGTPEAMYRDNGEAVWTCELNSYGKVRDFRGQYKTDCPFRYQGQYEDRETGLYYNRFRYYSPDEGVYLSQDPIKLAGGHTLYGYVHDINTWVDVLGLKGKGHMESVIIKDGVQLSKGQSGSKEPIKSPELQTSVDNSITTIQNRGEISPSYSGKCSEIRAIDDAHSKGYTKDDLKGSQIVTTFSGDGEGRGACDCCAEVIKDYGLEEVNKGCKTTMK